MSWPVCWPSITPRPIATLHPERRQTRSPTRRASRCGQPLIEHPGSAHERQAVAYLTQALELTQDPAEQAILLEKAGSAQTDADAEAAIEKFQRANEIYRELGNEEGLARSAIGIAKAFMLLYRPRDATPILEKTITDTPSIAGTPLAVNLQAELSRSYANDRDPRALDMVDRVLDQAEHLDLMPIVVEGLINRALVLGYAGRFYEPVTILRGVMPMAEAHGLDWSRVRAYNNLSVLLMSEDVEESLDALVRGMEVARRTGALRGADAFAAGTDPAADDARTVG